MNEWVRLEKLFKSFDMHFYIFGISAEKYRQAMYTQLAMYQ